ncbi:alkaline phosphatase family protein [Kitasatospora paracochleata]|uniref:AlkP superfamily pyrophosphatase or phosphodiesterase n=1 Tax=Kitasatospora paracochleata TaxID=58354 RepID=A0ABT1JAP2_9ACTN|nr:alkaline phosphatase family protein [Kitasatospora paracochleata]MCP2313736.1 putative AlkP superfamily pyrophosphatase or phosphodiesterase [Kitasatospora paracochleata]
MDSRRVLVVGIDGVRLDLLPLLDTPHLDELAKTGFLAPVEIDDATPTMSGPCWATVVTGVSVAKHGVWGNRFDGHRLDLFPDFTTRLAAEHRLKTFAVGGWEPMFLARQGGPLFAAPSRLSYLAAAADTTEAWEECDEQVTAEAVRILGSGELLHASFVYLGAVDETGHLLGCGPAYHRAVETADRRLGRILTAVRDRACADTEEWTVIVVTDHGHRDEGGHGGRSPQERTAWIAAAGPGIAPGTTPENLRHADVAATVYRALGITPDPHWTLDGTPFA